MNALELCFLFIIFGFDVKSQVLSFQNLICNSNDLKVLKNFSIGMETEIDGWTLDSSNCCDWAGITCSSSASLGSNITANSGKVVKLELPFKRLVGTLADSLATLDQLRTLNLSHNSLKGPLPSSLFHFLYLEILDLSGNEFSGFLPLSINLPSIRSLDMSDNNFQGPIAHGMCTNSTGIQFFKLSVNYFNGSIPQALETCRSLEQLLLDGNLLSGTISESLLNLPKLTHLILSDNALTGQLSIKHPSGLAHLDVSLNKLSGKVPDFFHWFPNLSYFSASSNNFYGGIPPSLSNSPSISYLRLGNNSLDGSINLNCSTMISLAVLDLGNNKFSGSIPDYLPSCQKLRAINLSRNNLTGQIPESFKNFQYLSFLSLSNCSLTNLSSSLKVLQHCPNLTVLILTRSFHSEQLPSDDSLRFKALKVLVISNCRLTGTIPQWLQGSSQLLLLDLSWNHLTGSIPPSLGNLRSLFYLDLSNNSLSGEIPKSLTQLQSLISGEILPKEPTQEFPLFKKRDMSGRESSLQYNQIMSFPPLLDLSNNFLNGPIWPEFGNLKMLHVLDLQHNNLSGSIPSALSGMTNIETLDLSYNNLTGSIPTSLVKLNFLSKFSVAHNNLRGLIPSGGQFSTFPNSSFEGNQCLCSESATSNCEFSRFSQESVDGSGSIFSIPVWVGYTTGFFLSAMLMNVLPLARDRTNVLLGKFINR